MLTPAGHGWDEGPQPRGLCPWRGGDQAGDTSVGRLADAPDPIVDQDGTADLRLRRVAASLGAINS